MTFSNSQPQNISPAIDAVQTSPTDLNGLSPLFQMLVSAALVLFAQFGVRRGPKTRCKIFAVLGLLYILYPGTHAEKRAFLKQLVARHAETQARLYARYLVWRQRKCWMWGGGFPAGALTLVPSVLSAARDRHSFDALIPD